MRPKIAPTLRTKCHCCSADRTISRGMLCVPLLSVTSALSVRPPEIDFHGVIS